MLVTCGYLLWYSMDMLKLPKAYLSYSQMRVWLDDKDQYRARYYLGQEQTGSRYLLFGSEMAKGLEEGTIHIPSLIQYPVKEEQIKLDVEGVPFYAYIDQFWPEKVKFREIKTGIKRKDGSPRWTQDLVNKHMQLDVYSLLIQEKYGSVDDECHLDWIITRNKKKTIEMMGHVLESESGELEITGEVVSFARVITSNERARIKFLIRSIAEEISQDYSEYLRFRPATSPDFNIDASSSLSGKSSPSVS